MTFIEKLKEIELHFQNNYSEFTAYKGEYNLETNEFVGLCFKYNKLIVLIDNKEVEFEKIDNNKVLFNIISKYLEDLEADLRAKKISTFKKKSSKMLREYKDLAREHIQHLTSMPLRYRASYKGKLGPIRDLKEEAIQDCIRIIIENE